MYEGRILHLIRLKENLTQNEMANKLNISKSLYCKLEYGKRNISKKLLQKIKKEYPEININIFFDNKKHVSCYEDIC